MRGIPTTYKGIDFRSRLEAKWATFFDLLGWKWEYEPFDLNGWIPDFILIGKNQTTLVEVKPYTRLDEFKECREKVNQSVKGTSYELNEILYLGCTLPWSENYGGINEAKALGWLDDKMEIDTACLNNYNNWGFFHSMNSYLDRITGMYDGDGCIKIPNPHEVDSLFNEAGNSVQWKGNNDQI